MARYYFDVVEDDVFYRDTEGTELRNAKAARLEATQALAELALDTIPGTIDKHLHMTVRESSGRVVFSLDLFFKLTV